MNKLKIIALGLLLQQLLTGCGTKSNQARDDIDPEEIEKKQNPIIIPFRESFTSEVNAILERANCSKFPEICELQEFDFTSGTFKWPDDSKTVLVLDGGMELTGVSKLRNRTKAMIKPDANGIYYEYNPKITTSKGWFEVVGKAIGQSEHFMSGFLIEDHFKNFHERFQPLLSGWKNNEGHGSIVANIIAEYSPSMSFVMGDLWNYEKEYLCKKDYDYFNQLADNLSSSLAEIIAKHNIKFINLSAGDDSAHFERLWKSYNCNGTISKQEIDELLFIIKRVYQNLSAIPGVILVQAAPNNSFSGTTAEQNVIDCSKFPNRISVSHFSNYRSGINENGAVMEEFYDSIDPQQRMLKPCIDIYINSGYRGQFHDEKEPHVLVVADSVSLRTKTVSYIMTNSWAAPLAVSYLHHQITKENYQFTSGQDLIHQITSDRELMLQDPLWNRDLELFNH